MQHDKEKEKLQFLENILDNIPFMLFVKDASELRFKYINRAAEAIIGIPAHVLIGKNDYDFFPSTQADQFSAKDQQVI